MSVVSTIHFTQEQARTLTGVSVETVRHWRTAIPYLAAKSGKATRFSFTDLVALAVINLLVSSLGVRVTAFSAGADALFKMLAETGPTALNNSIVLMTTSSAVILEPGTDQNCLIPANPGLLVKLAPLIENIQRQVLPTPDMVQLELPFSTMVIRGRV